MRSSCTAYPSPRSMNSSRSHRRWKVSDVSLKRLGLIGAAIANCTALLPREPLEPSLGRLAVSYGVDGAGTVRAYDDASPDASPAKSGLATPASAHRGINL